MRLKQETKNHKETVRNQSWHVWKLSGTGLEPTRSLQQKTQQGVCFVGTLPGREGWDDDGEDGREKKLWEASGTDVFQGGRLEGWWRGCS